MMLLGLMTTAPVTMAAAAEPAAAEGDGAWLPADWQSIVADWEEKQQGPRGAPLAEVGGCFF
jgi:hypothetical protein